MAVIHDFSATYLTKKEIQMLRSLRSGRAVKYNEKYHSLCILRFARVRTDTRIEITELGSAFLDYRKSRSKEFWIPIIISVIFSTVAMLTSIISAITK